MFLNLQVFFIHVCGDEKVYNTSGALAVSIQ